MDPKLETIVKADTSESTNPRVENPNPAKKPLAKSPWRRRILWAVVAILLAITGVYGYYLLFSKPAKQYATAVVARGDVASLVVAAGIIQPIKYVDVGAQTSGKLKSLKVVKGDQVKEHQLIAEIDTVLSQTAIMSAVASFENMRSQHALKQAQLVLAKLQKERNDKLFSTSVISASDHDITQANYAVAVADVAALSAQMRQATAVVNTAQANLGYTRITAPMAGEIVSISLVEGQTLNANQQAPNILRIADVSTVTIWAQVSEADIVRVRIGQDVYFTILGSARRWNGKVQQILPTPELINNVVFFDVLFDIPNPERVLKIQMTAQVFIVLAQAKNVLLIPIAAIGNAAEGAKTKVKVLNAEGHTELRAITIGIKSEIFAEVTMGLKENEKVVIGETTTQDKTKSALNGPKGL